MYTTSDMRGNAEAAHAGFARPGTSWTTWPSEESLPVAADAQRPILVAVDGVVRSGALLSPMRASKPHSSLIEAPEVMREETFSKTGYNST